MLESWVQSKLGFVGFTAWVMGSLPRFVRSLLEFVGFVAWVRRWVRWFVGLSIGFVVGFVVDLLLRVISALISYLCLCLCFCCLFGCRGFFFSRGCHGFFQRGRRGRRSGDLSFLVFFCGTRVFKTRVLGEISLKLGL